VKEDEQEPKPSVLPERDAMALIGQEPPEGEAPEVESREPPTEAGDIPRRR
jgi:hypothetical protein